MDHASHDLPGRGKSRLHLIPIRHGSVIYKSTHELMAQESTVRSRNPKALSTVVATRLVAAHPATPRLVTPRLATHIMLAMLAFIMTASAAACKWGAPGEIHTVPRVYS